MAENEQSDSIDDWKLLAKLRGRGKVDLKLEYPENLIEEYNLFRQTVFDPKSVLYPSSGYDASPSRTFGNVTFVDIDGDAMQKMREAGLNGVHSDIREYTPKEEHDLLILLNPAIQTEWAAKHLKSGGYIISNDYHGNASQMHSQPDKFSLFGTIESPRDKPCRISGDLEGLFVPVKDEAELTEFRPDALKVIRGYIETIRKNSPKMYQEQYAGKSFEESWAKFREELGCGKPYKRVASSYIFVKK